MLALAWSDGTLGSDLAKSVGYFRDAVARLDANSLEGGESRYTLGAMLARGMVSKTEKDVNDGREMLIGIVRMLEAAGPNALGWLKNAGVQSAFELGVSYETGGGVPSLVGLGDAESYYAWAGRAGHKEAEARLAGIRAWRNQNAAPSPTPQK